MKRTGLTLFAATMTAGTMLLAAQEISPASQLTERGEVVVGGRSVGYAIHRLPVNAFPELPPPIADQLEQRGCTVPQTYEAHKPENVVHASLERAGASDWAVLCSAKGTVSLLVFFASAFERPTVLASAAETERLQEHGASELLGFNWGIDSASPDRVHEAQSNMRHRPARPDHDALADSLIDHSTVYRFYSKGRWTVLDTLD